MVKSAVTIRKSIDIIGEHIIVSIKPKVIADIAFSLEWSKLIAVC